MLRKIFIAATVFLLLPLSVSAQQRKITVSGHITDVTSGETLIGAGVIYEDGQGRTGAVTNNFGYYSLTFSPEGNSKTVLSCSHVGYSTEYIEIGALRDTVVNIALSPSETLSASVVTARRDAGIKSTYLGAIDVPLTHIQNVPSLLGETDVLKAIQLLPGVQGGNEGFAGLYVRGGGPDENLILLDGSPIYNVDHLLGLFSVFQAEAVKKVTLYKGSFPARYGGRVSSIVDIRTNDGNMKETHGSVGIGIVTDKFHLEGPIIKDKLSYSISARGMHTAIYNPFIKAYLKHIKSEEFYNYYYYDLNGKLSWRLSDKDRFYLGVYQGEDKFKYTDDYSYTWSYGPDSIVNEETDHDGMGIKWGNLVTTLRWNHIFSNRLFSNTTVAFNRYRSDISSISHEKGTTDGEPFQNRYDVTYRSGIRDLSAKVDFDYNPSPKHLVKFGGEYLYHTFIPETLSTVDEESGTGTEQVDTTYNIIDNKRFHGHDLSVYAEDDMSLGDHFTFNPGVHIAWFNTQGRNYLSFQPRIAFKYMLDEDLSFKAGYARMAQYVHLLSSSQISLPIDLWVPITKDIKPVTSDQFSVGAYYNGVKDWEMSVEAYWKEMYNVLEYKDAAIVLGNMGGWENQVEMGRGRAYGIEFFLQKVSGKTTGWISYTLARSERWFPDGSINQGKVFPYKYDRRHNFNISVTHKFSKKLDIEATWQFATGGATTIATRQTAVIGVDGDVYEVDYVQARNNYRLPCSHRLNAGLNHHKQKKHGEATWTFGVYNMYNQMNPNFVYLEEENGQKVLKKITILPVIPSISYTYEF